MRLASLVALNALVVACGSAPSRPAAAPQETEVTGAALPKTGGEAGKAREAESSASTKAPDTACKVLAGEQKAGADQLRSIVRNLDPMSRTAIVSDDMLRSFEACYAGKGGAWGLVLRDVQQANGGTTGRLFVTHVDKAGAKAEWAPIANKAEMKFNFTDQEQVAFDVPMMFDYDADGHDEFLLTGHRTMADRSVQPFGFVVSRKGATAQAYAQAAELSFFQAKDVDADGRPDLLVRPYRDYVKDSCSGELTLVEGPVFAAHATTDGAFSLTDSVAMSKAKEACPEKPKAVVSRIDGSRQVDEQETEHNVACARAWGEPEAAVMGAIAQCRTMRAGEGCQQSALESCRRADMLKAWARKKPVVRIK